MPTRRPLAILLASVAVAAAACGGSGPASTPGSSPGSSPGATPEGSPTGIQHPTGATDVVLRYEETGGMMMPEWVAAQTPVFTLYGDGTVVFVALDPTPPEAAPGEPILRNPLRVGKLTPEAMQQLLEFALRDGGLAAAKLRYDEMTVSDASTAIFTVNAGGTEKVVSVYALGNEAQPGPDSAIKAAMAALRDRLADFDQGGTIPSEAYVPAAYRGVLFDAAGMQGVQPIAWPWPDLTPQDFALPQDPNGIQLRTRGLTPEEVAALGIEGIEGGGQGIYLSTDDGTLYSLVVRPLLPGEEAVPPPPQ